MIGVLADHNHAAAIAREAHRLNDGIAGARCFNGDVGAAAIGSFPDPLQTFAFIVRFEIENVRRSGFRC